MQCRFTHARVRSRSKACPLPPSAPCPAPRGKEQPSLPPQSGGSCPEGTEGGALDPASTTADAAGRGWHHRASGIGRERGVRIVAGWLIAMVACIASMAVARAQAPAAGDMSIVRIAGGEAALGLDPDKLAALGLRVVEMRKARQHEAGSPG